MLTVLVEVLNASVVALISAVKMKEACCFAARPEFTCH